MFHPCDQQMQLKMLMLSPIRVFEILVLFEELDIFDQKVTDVPGLTVSRSDGEHELFVTEIVALFWDVLDIRLV